MTPSLRLAARTALLLVAVLLLGASFAPGLALAQEEEPPPAPEPVTVTLTAEGITPEFIEVPVGGAVLFVNDTDQTHRITATVEEGKSTAWEYDSGPLTPRDGETRASSQTEPFEAAGRYTFSDAFGLLLGESRADEINVLPPPPPAVPAEPAPAGEPSAEPSSEPGSQPSGEPAPGPSDGGAPGAQPGASPGAAPGAPAPTGGTGTTAPLPLSGGFGSFGSTPQPIPGLDPLAPAIAPPLVLAAPPATTLLPDVAPSAPSELRTTEVTALPTGSLPGAVTDRAYGLPAALATVTLLGVVSLLVRVLLAEPVPGRGTADARAPRPVTVTA